jgi:hypothetical protein
MVQVETSRITVKISGFHGDDYEECHLLGCHRVVLVATDVSEELIASIFRVKTINGLQHVSNS